MRRPTTWGWSEAGGTWREGVSGRMHVVGGRRKTKEEDEGQRDISSLYPIERKMTGLLQ